jgi:DNA-binding transcriptional LysR family regulator
MELMQLKYFLKAKELLNFMESARAFNIGQSTLLQQIKQLEDGLNVPLFNPPSGFSLQLKLINAKSLKSFDSRLSF